MPLDITSGTKLKRKRNKDNSIKTDIRNLNLRLFTHNFANDGALRQGETDGVDAGSQG